jgi:hypothetical protein
MGLFDKAKKSGAGGGKDDGAKRAGDESREKPDASSRESLPGGASGGEAANTNPQRAAELAD